MGTGGYVAVGIGVLALAVVAYFVFASNKSTPTRASTPAQGNQTLATVGQVSAGVGALAGFGTALVGAYENS